MTTETEPETTLNLIDDTKSDSEKLDELLATYNKPLVIDEPIIEKQEVKERPIVEGETRKRGRPPKHEKEEFTVPSDTFLDGAIFLMLIDIAIPNLIVFADKKITGKKSSIKAKDLQLTPEQERKLQPLADAVVKKLSVKATPETLLLWGIITSYGVNYMMVKMDRE